MVNNMRRLYKLFMLLFIFTISFNLIRIEKVYATDNYNIRFVDGANQGNYSSCDSLLGDPNDTDSVAWLVQTVLNYIRLIGILLVVVLSSLDFIKAVISGDDKGLSKAGINLGVRLVIIVLLYLLPSVVMFLFDLTGITSSCTLG